MLRYVCKQNGFSKRAFVPFLTATSYMSEKALFIDNLILCGFAYFQKSRPKAN